MDKVGKFLKKLTAKELAVVELTLVSLQTNNLEKLDIKKLKGYVDIYRVRVGTLRIIYQKTPSTIIVLEISHRSETTYRDF
jgi:mRNA-degrading endonuclease RelE of RelBE toxin-antitoxin system